MQNLSVMRVPRSVFGVSNSEMNRALRHRGGQDAFKERVCLIAVAANLTEEDLLQLEARGNEIKKEWRALWQAREAAEAAAVRGARLSSSPAKRRDRRHYP